MKIAVMQPYFFPYIAYWQLINAVDTFVIYDDVSYIKGGYINRNSLLGNSNSQLVTLELIGASSNKQINQINALETLRKTIIESKKKYDEEQLAKLKTIKTDIKKYKGKLIWPVDGKIVKGFGPQWNPKLNTTLDNPGIDIAANSTAPVKSVFDGLVTTITFISGYGTTVIIDHDDGYFTVFTHLENLLINENMIVKEGQEIGFVSNNNIIHFEIWGNNQKLNPTQWIKNGYK